MKILVACEFSCRIRDAFLLRGHDAYSCDLLMCWGPPYERHFRQDVRPLLREKWDLVIAHPPCTYLTNAACHLMYREERYRHMLDAVAFFQECLLTNARKVAVENPIMNAEAKKHVPKYDQIIHPWQFGHDQTKPTCLWLRGLSLLTPTHIVKPRAKIGSDGKRNMLDNKMGPRKFRGQLRSVTFQGIADAMAEQWGS